jgi:DNA-binding HxlR family transcriptional regulator
VTMNVLSGKWKRLMLWRLHDGTKPYQKLEQIDPGVNHHFLTHAG